MEMFGVVGVYTLGVLSCTVHVAIDSDSFIAFQCNLYDKFRSPYCVLLSL